MLDRKISSHSMKRGTDLVGNAMIINIVIIIFLSLFLL